MKANQCTQVPRVLQSRTPALSSLIMQIALPSYADACINQYKFVMLEVCICSWVFVNQSCQREAIAILYGMIFKHGTDP